jgi:PAS domain S-box-containing protein
MQTQINFRHIFEATSNGVIVTDTNGEIVHINRQAEGFLHLSPNCSDGIHIKKISKEFGNIVSKSLELETPILGHKIVTNKYSVIVNITPIFEKKEKIGVVCNFQEMELFERSARQLESYSLLNKQLKAIFNSVSDTIWVCDGQGVVLDINKASEKINAIKAKDIIGKKVADLVKGGMFDQSVTDLVLKRKKQVTIVQRIMKTGKDVLATGTPVFNEKGEISLVVVNSRDVSELNKIQKELQDSRLEAQKFKEKLMELSFQELKEQNVIAENRKMRDLLKVAFKLSNLEVPNILILGESGTGKGLIAKFVHQNGKRVKEPFIQINCAALPENLLEAELFGYEKGAFTGAKEQGKIGLIELAQNGTLFLDEIGDLPLSLQAKILKYLDDGEVLRIGSVNPVKTNCMVIAATNQDLQKLVRNGRFRKDLFYRLNTFTLQIPSLRERPEDIIELTRHFLQVSNKKYSMKKRITACGLGFMRSYSFPGNIRELKSIINNAVVISEDDHIDVFIQNELKSKSDSGLSCPDKSQRSGSFESQIDSVEKEIILASKAKYGSTRAIAKNLQISQATVIRKMKKLGIPRLNRIKNESINT